MTVGATAGLILAAGAGTRFGATPKQLATLGDRPLLQWAIDAQTSVDPAVLDPIVVVLGARAAEVAAGVRPGRARTVVCEGWDRGQAVSLRCGLRALDGAERVLVTLGDAPLISGDVIARFAGENAPVRAVYDGRPGHPVLLGAEQLSALEAAGAGDDPPAPRGLLSDVRRIEVGHLCCGRDVDTPADLEEIRDEARAVV